MLIRARPLIAAFFLALLALAVVAQAKPRTQRKFLKAYPQAKNTRLQDCAACHIPKTTELNPYGQALKDSTMRFALVEHLDSDADSVSNLLEIKLLSFPGDSADTPDSAAVAMMLAAADSAKAAAAKDEAAN